LNFNTKSQQKIIYDLQNIDNDASPFLPIWKIDTFFEDLDWLVWTKNEWLTFFNEEGTV
jgi:hypothetical protein